MPIPSFVIAFNRSSLRGGAEHGELLAASAADTERERSDQDQRGSRVLHGGAG
jgi:hypothetical protein